MTDTLKARPFLKWVGGKQKLLPELLVRAPKKFARYHEPFLGGGALFFALQPKRAVLSDINPDLVYTYRALRDNPERVILLLKDLINEREKRGHLVHYLKVRKKKMSELTECAIAARTIYLNKTCFNGLWRVNKKGEFNVPIGKSKSPPTICDEENLLNCSTALQNVEICRRDFRGSMEEIDSGDFAYLDPPYVPLSATSDFTSYAREGFGPVDQADLARLALEAKRRGATILLSNSGCEVVEKLYADPLFTLTPVDARRNVNCDGGKRSAVREYLIS